jgi:hypothetical protein
MGRLIALVLGGFGLGAYFQSRRRRQPALDRAPALELKAKLAESRAAVLEADPARDDERQSDQPPASGPEQEAEPQPEPTLEGDLAARRRALHDQTRGAIDELS